MNIKEILIRGVEEGASDIFIIAGLPLSFKIHNVIRQIDDTPLRPADTEALVLAVYELSAAHSADKLLAAGDDDFSLSLPGVSRFRCSAYRQRGSLAAVIRVVSFELPRPQDIGIPETVIGLGDYRKGLVLITGSAGSGKSTTLACLIDHINHSRNSHVITLEDPMEFLHRHEKSVISQREIATDTGDYATALRAALRQSPDVILLGEMRDHETIQIAMTAAETGHLVISTLHTVGVANAIDRIIDVFPVNQQTQIRVQLSMVLQAVVSQQLLPTTDGKLTPAFEIMTCNNAIRNMIRESKIHQLDAVIAASGEQNMTTMNHSLEALFHAGRISRETALTYSLTPEQLSKKLQQG